jgi:hypothetical protein
MVESHLDIIDKEHPFTVEPHQFGFRPGTDLDRLNQLVDELEAEEVARKLDS